MALFIPNPDAESVEEIIEQLSLELARAYRDVEDQIIREVAERALRDMRLAGELPSAPAGAGLTVAERRRQNRILAELAGHRAVAIRELQAIAVAMVERLRVSDMAEQIIEIAAREGEAAAAAQLGFAARQGVGVASIPFIGSAAATSVTTLTGTATQAAAMVALSLQSRLEVLNQRITRYPQDAYQRIVALYSPGTLLGVTTSKQQQAAAVQRFLSEGISAFGDRSGRRWTIGAYAEMAGRTSVNRAYNDAGVWRMQQSGLNLVTVVRGLDSCRRCAAWAGKILSTDGTPAGEYPMRHATGEQSVTVRVDATVEAARNGGLFHPNCRCRLVPYFPGLTVPQSDTTYDEAAEKERAEQRRLEREIRAAKRREASAMSDTDRRKATRDVRDAQADMRAFISATGRNRQSYREQLHFADGRGRGARGATFTPPRTPAPPAGSLSRPAPVRTQAEFARKYGVDFGRDRVETHELEFFDRFIQAGQTFTYLPRHPYLPTNDIRWHEQGDMPTEIKSILGETITAKSLYRPVRDAVKKSTAAGVPKANFIIDIRDHEATAEILRLLRRYNLDNAHARISRLFLMARGSIREVDLE